MSRGFGCSGRDPASCDLYEGWIQLDSDETEPLHHGRLPGASRAHERVQDHPSDRGYQSAEVAHEVGGFNCWMRRSGTGGRRPACAGSPGMDCPCPVLIRGAGWVVNQIVVGGALSCGPADIGVGSRCSVSGSSCASGRQPLWHVQGRTSASHSRHPS